MSNILIFRKRPDGRDFLMMLKFIRELIFNEHTTLRCSKISSTESVLLVVEWFVDDSYSRSLANGDSYHTCYMMSITLSKALSSIKRINPDDHIIFKNFAWVLIVLHVFIISFLLVDFFKISEVLSVELLICFIVLKQQGLRNCFLINLVR